MKSVWKFLTSRMTFTIMLLVFQIALLLSVLLFLKNINIFIYYGTFYALSTLVTIWIINRNDNPAYKISWIILIMLVPIVGGVLYLLFGKSRTTKKMKKNMQKFLKDNQTFLPFNETSLDHLRKKGGDNIVKQARYLQNMTNQPLWENTQTTFLSPGEEIFEQFLLDLQSAKKFIFLEYFIIRPGFMWSSILRILIEKVKQNVEVYLLYDDLGTIHTLPSNYHQLLTSFGINVAVFNPFQPKLNAFMNNRDHRKILVVDGQIAYTGGFNLADEYINYYQRFGYWKDSAVRLEGSAVNTFTLMFMEFYEYVSSTSFRYKQYLTAQPRETDGYVLPFDDNPIDDTRAAEMTYLHMIHSATKSIYIQTPYLVMDNELTTALCLAARSGIDVKIVTPGIPDKFYVYALTRNSYKELLENHVKIYEYTPGFIHSKILIVDEVTAVIGTINFDFRSLYLHFECGVWLYESHAIKKALADFKNILTVSKSVDNSYCKSFKWHQKLLGIILKIFAPLM